MAAPRPLPSSASFISIPLPGANSSMAAFILEKNKIDAYVYLWGTFNLEHKYFISAMCGTYSKESLGLISYLSGSKNYVLVVQSTVFKMCSASLQRNEVTLIIKLLYMWVYMGIFKSLIFVGSVKLYLIHTHLYWNCGCSLYSDPSTDTVHLSIFCIFLTIVTIPAAASLAARVEAASQTRRTMRQS